MMIRLVLLSLALLGAATQAVADFTKVQNQDEFLSYVNGKTLTLPLVKLRVTSDGRIMGMGARWEVTGDWSWKDGYFCRQIYWGGDDIGYNCQEVQVNDNRIRFTSDKGTGQSAVFRMR